MEIKIMKRSLLSAQWTVILLFLVPCLVCPSGTLSVVRAETDPSYSSSLLRNPQSPFTHIFSRSIPSSQEDEKTDSKSYEYVDSDESGVTEQYLESATRPLPSIPPALRRHFARLTATTPEPEVEATRKPTKKPKRRRKVKRPTKKSTTPKGADDDLGIPENAGRSNATAGEKNLALEIGSDDGKYALINVFFDHNNKSKAPGVLSYQQSDDFKKDNDKTLGNLQQNDIWLSEGHLLILKGGDLDSNSKDKWKPIDSYERVKPYLKIPLDTDNPPPFPVFINDTGPPIFIGPPPPFGPYIPDLGSNETFDPSRLPPPGLIPLYPNGSIPEFFRPPPGFSLGNNSLPPPPFHFPRPGPPPQQGGVYGKNPPSGGVYGGGGPPGPGYGYGGNAPPSNFNISNLPPFYPPSGNNDSRLPGPPFFPFGPPGDRPGPGGPLPFLPPLVLNPNDNETDDPSIFLPPPYDFDYHEDNSTIVPPGPFAPGLVVPPPKGFYTVYNRTSPAYDSRPPLPTNVTPFLDKYDGRSQRPNAKKPKFPITNPPDDSLEAAYPVTSPSPIISTTYIKKRKRPGKTNKIYLNPLLTKYSKGESTSEEVSGEVQQEPINDYKPVILIPRPLTTTTTTTTTPKAPNYVYVRGQLKTLAELEAEEEEVEEGFTQQISTPRPPFDELGYPSRTVDDNINQPIIFDFPRKTTTKVPSKLYYQNTPKYNPSTYNPNVYIKKKDKYPTVYPTRPYTQGVVGEQNLIQPSQRPIIFQQDPQNIQNNNERHILYPDNYTRHKAGIIRPTHFIPSVPSTTNGQSQDQSQRTSFKPNQLQLYNPNEQQQQQQPYLLDPSTSRNNNGDQSLLARPNSGFRPAFPPPQVPNRSRSQILFPGPTNQQPYSYNPIYQQPNNLGYYSPITQYHQPLDSNLNIPNQYYPSQQPIPTQGSNYNTNNNNNNGQVPQYFQPQQFHPHQQYQHEIQPSYNPQNYIQQIQQQQLLQQQQQRGGQGLVPLHRDVLVNYREPLPQYNTESEAITARSIVTKAGPGPSIQYGSDHTGAGSSTSAVQSTGSFYSFQRGGPGGFSYKIRL